MRLSPTGRRAATLFSGLLIGLTAPVAAHAQAKPAPGKASAGRGVRADSIPSDGWVELYFSSFDPAARAAGLTPLREMRLRPGEREVRLWTQVEIGIPKQFYRFVDRGGAVRGELIFYWGAEPPDTARGERAGETTHDLMQYTLAGRCGGFAVAEATGVCRARFRREPPWGAVLRAVEAEGLWSIPDPSALPSDSVMAFDGWTIVAELRDGPRYRTFRYNSPDLHPKWPSAAQVETIVGELGAIDTLVAPSDAQRTYRGVTTGRYQSAFRACGDTARWEFHDELRRLASHAPDSVRATLPAALTDTKKDAVVADTLTVYTVEVFAELSPAWLARQWESKFPRVLQPFVLQHAQVGVAPDCGAGRPR
jgi:hypothetical protein